MEKVDPWPSRHPELVQVTAFRYLHGADVWSTSMQEALNLTEYQVHVAHIFTDRINFSCW